MAEQFRARAVTHPGTVRAHNEDVFVDRPDIGLWAVADGAGGHEAGEVASAMIAAALGSITGPLGGEEMVLHVRQRMTETHAALQERAAQTGDGAIIASTVVVLVVGQGRFGCLWAGDSRAYLLRNDAVPPAHPRPQPGAGTGRCRPPERQGTPSAIRAPTSSPAPSAPPADALELDMVTGAVVPRRPLPAVHRRPVQSRRRHGAGRHPARRRAGPRGREAAGGGARASGARQRHRRGAGGRRRWTSLTPRPPRSANTRSAARSAAARWAPSTTAGTRSSAAASPSRRCACWTTPTPRRRRGWSASSARRRRRAGCRTPTSSASTTTARPTRPPTSSWSSSKASR